MKKKDTVKKDTVKKDAAQHATRVERDSMGEMRVPSGAYYGAQTQRAVENFPISGIRFPRPMIRALGLIKKSAAQVNGELKLLDLELSSAIQSAAASVERGDLDDQFVVDIFQTGSGTSTNMNANEVIARLAQELGGNKLAVHPNDHVNMCQSSNDVIPSAIHIAVVSELKESLLPALQSLSDALKRKSNEFASLIKTGRTHLQDATPLTLGQEFSGYQSQIEHGISRLKRSLDSLYELALGGTAVGTGLNAHPEFARRTIAEISRATGSAFREASNHFEAQSARDALVEISGQLKTVACSLAKIAQDIRWLSSGPRCGLGELSVPEVQPGSSIMPGKVNPVIIESLLMVVVQVLGNDASVTAAGYSGGAFELHAMMPVMAHNILESIGLLSTSVKNFATQCVNGIQANVERLTTLAELSLATCTALAPAIGYDAAAALAKEAFKSRESIRVVAKRRKILPDAELDTILDLRRMTKPGLSK